MSVECICLYWIYHANIWGMTVSWRVSVCHSGTVLGMYIYENIYLYWIYAATYPKICHKKLVVTKNWMSQKLVVTKAGCLKSWLSQKAGCHKSWLSDSWTSESWLSGSWMSLCRTQEPNTKYKICVRFFYFKSEEIANENMTNFNWVKTQEVPNVAHNASQMAEDAVKYLYPE